MRTASNTNTVRLAYLVSHPIQYQAPLLRRIAATSDISLTVFFCSDISIRAYDDPGFGVKIEWDTPLLDGYDHVFLPMLGPADKLSSFRPFTYGLARELRRGNFDALWIHSYGRLSNIWAMVTAKRLGIKVLVRDEASSISTHRSAAKRLLKRLFFTALFPLIDGFLAIGTWNRSYYLAHRFREDRIFPVPYAVDNDWFRAQAQEAEANKPAFRAELGLEPGRPVILYASKLARRKRADDLLEAFGLLTDSKQANAPYLLFVGDGELRASLMEEAESRDLSNVRFLGFQNQTALPAIFNLADIFVLPSDHEPWGLVVNEAMASGCAIIASDQVGGAQDLIRDGENGFIFPAGDVDALHNALEAITADPDRMAEMAARSQEIIGQWGYPEDEAGLRLALRAVAGKADLAAGPVSPAKMGFPAGRPME